MKARLHRTSAGLIALVALAGCGRETVSQSQSEETVSLVAALAATEAGADASDTGVAGEEPFFVAGCNADEVVAQVLDRLDADGDGNLSAEELAAVEPELGGRKERHALLFRMYDADDSGSIEAAELASFESDVTARCESRKQALLARFDANGDGTLDADEQQAAEDTLRARFNGRHRHADAGAGDVDGDRGGRGRGIDFGRRRSNAEARFDADGDGQLNAAEDASARDHLRGCVRGDHPMEGGDEPPAAEPAPEGTTPDDTGDTVQ